MFTDVAFAVAAGMPVQSARPPVPYIERSLYSGLSSFWVFENELMLYGRCLRGGGRNACPISPPTGTKFK